MKPMVVDASDEATDNTGAVVTFSPPTAIYDARVGIRGVRLKNFEAVVTDLLRNGLVPRFSRIPPLPSPAVPHTDIHRNESKDDGDSGGWPFSVLPPQSRVLGTGRGQLSDLTRAVRKENQLRSLMRCVVAMLPKEKSRTTTTIVDFGGGTGHLAIPLALLLPQCEVVVVDLKAASLNLVHQKSLQFVANDDEEKKKKQACFSYPKQASKRQQPSYDCKKRPCVGIPNLSTYHGPIESYGANEEEDSFDIGVALHACGEASDWVLRVCGRARAGFVVAPCCVGKLNENKHNPYVFQATGTNMPTVRYPQSTAFGHVLQQQCSGGITQASQWNALAKAADYSDWDEMRSSRNATRRTAKALLEHDRLLFAQETYGYKTALTRMDPWEASPKNDILLGWFDKHNDDDNNNNDNNHSPFGCNNNNTNEVEKGPVEDADCNADIQSTKEHLLESRPIDKDTVDWTLAEVEEMREFLAKFVEGKERKYIFPTKMGGRRRKLVHHVAEEMGLAHWCHGKLYAEKTVAVAKRAPRATTTNDNDNGKRET